MREIVERLCDGDTGTAIARDLNQRGVLTGLGAQWTGAGVKACAKRASNAGLRSHHGTIYPGTWEAIVSREQWERVTAVLSRPAATWRRGTGRKYPFQGFVRCAVCGGVMNVATGRSNAGIVAYRCDPYRSANPTEKTGCGGVQRQQAVVDYLIKEALIDRLSGDGFMRAMETVASQDKAVSAVVSELQEQRTRLDALVDDYAAGVLDRAQFTRAKGVAQARVAELERQASSMTGTQALKRGDASQGVRAMIAGADLALLRDITELLVKEVRIKPMPKSGYRVKYLDVDGRRYRFDADLVEIYWQA